MAQQCAERIINDFYGIEFIVKDQPYPKNMIIPSLSFYHEHGNNPIQTDQFRTLIHRTKESKQGYLCKCVTNDNGIRAAYFTWSSTLDLSCNDYGAIGTSIVGIEFPNKFIGIVDEETLLVNKTIPIISYSCPSNNRHRLQLIGINENYIIEQEICINGRCSTATRRYNIITGEGQKMAIHNGCCGTIECIPKGVHYFIHGLPQNPWSQNTAIFTDWSTDDHAKTLKVLAPDDIKSPCLSMASHYHHYNYKDFWIFAMNNAQQLRFGYEVQDAHDKVIKFEGFGYIAVDGQINLHGDMVHSYHIGNDIYHSLLVIRGPFNSSQYYPNRSNWFAAGTSKILHINQASIMTFHKDERKEVDFDLTPFYDYIKSLRIPEFNIVGYSVPQFGFMKSDIIYASIGIINGTKNEYKLNSCTTVFIAFKANGEVVMRGEVTRYGMDCNPYKVAAMRPMKGRIHELIANLWPILLSSTSTSFPPALFDIILAYMIS